VDDPLLGVTVGSWKLTYLLGAGGMGRVYAAIQPEIGAKVAIKVIKADSPPDVVERFFNEARAVNLIRHENIVDVIDLGRLPDGAPYIVMGHLDGASLGALLRRSKKLDLGSLGRIVDQVLSALEAAHGKGVIHRDLKPDNVFVSPSGHATVLDFGVAKLSRGDGLDATRTGNLLGTPAYMSPEQARTQPIDARSDLYAVGVILYEGATGRLPFVADNLFDLLDLQVRAAPPPPRSLDPAIPQALEAVILRALAKDPADRFASAADMRAALAAAVDGLPRPSKISLPPPIDRDALSTAETMDSGDPKLQATKATISPPPSALPPPAARQLTNRTRIAIVAGSGMLAAAGITLLVLHRTRREAAPPPVDAGVSRTDPAPSGAFDPIARYPQIAAQAANAAGAKVLLHWLDFLDLNPDGTLGPKSAARYIFISPERARAGGECMIELRVTTAGTEITDEHIATADPDTPAPCTGQTAPPRCSFAQLRARAVAQGLDPASTEPVTLARTGAYSWIFAAGGSDYDFADDCE